MQNSATEQPVCETFPWDKGNSHERVSEKTIRGCPIATVRRRDGGGGRGDRRGLLR